MAAPFQTHLDAAMAPLLARTARRVARVKRLSEGPQTDATAKALAAEQAEIQLVAQLAADLSRVLGQMQRVIQHNTAKCHQLGSQLAVSLQTAADWEQRFYLSLTTLPELAEEKAPPFVLAGYAAMIRSTHLRTSPLTYRATFPAPFPNPQPLPAHV